MKLQSTCPCGAKFEGEDDTFLVGGGHPDSQGRVYTLQVTFDRWVDAHRDHKTSLTKEFFG
jgi:hypothetical protein